MKLYLDFFLVFCLFVYNYFGKPFTPLVWIGLLIGIPSYFLWIVARVQLGKHFSTLPRARGLVTKGLYSRLRNPVYLFSTLSTIGAILPSKSILQYLFLTTIMVLQLIRSSKEERILKQKFGKRYSQYKAQTWF